MGMQIRLGWHDAGTYDKNIAEFPKRGAANGSLRFVLELSHTPNAGNSQPSFLISWSDFWGTAVLLEAYGSVCGTGDGKEKFADERRLQGKLYNNCIPYFRILASFLWG